MRDFADDLIQSLEEAVAHANGRSAAVLHEPLSPNDVCTPARVTHASMVPLAVIPSSDCENGQLIGEDCVLLRSSGCS